MSGLFASAAEQLRFAKKLYSDRLFDEAYLLINQIITEFPNAPETAEARYLISQIQYEKKSYQDARMQLITLLRNPFQLPHDLRVKAYFALGMVHFREKNYTSAIENFEKIFLDYRETPEAIEAITYYFESYFLLGEFQTVIVKTRDLQRNWKQDRVLADLMYYQARAYFASNMPEQANRAIRDIRSKYPETEAAWKAIELQILLIEKDQGQRAAAERLEVILSEPISRNMEEKLSWLLVRYYLNLNDTIKAKQRVDFLVNKFNRSDNLNEYLITWMQVFTKEKDLKPILDSEDHILRANRGKDTYLTAIYYLAKTHFLAQDYWKARTYLDEHISQVISDGLLFDYEYLYAEIYSAQGQFINSINKYNQLLNRYGNLGRNYYIFMQLGDIYLHQYNQEAQALNYYRQAANIASDVEKVSNALQMTSLCLESLGQYNEALWTLLQIPLEKIEDRRVRESIINKISLIQIFYHAETQEAFSNYMLRSLESGGALQIIDYSTILAMDLKRYDKALEVLSNNRTYNARVERVKLYFLYAYKHHLEGNQTQSKDFLQKANNEISQLGDNINDEDAFLFTAFKSFLENNAKINAQNLNSAIGYVNSIPVNNAGINFRNFFQYQLWAHYNDTDNLGKMRETALNIKKDTFVGELEFQRVNTYLANWFYSQKDYQQALNFFEKAPRYLTLSNTDFFYKYSMCLYQLGNKDKALELLQKLVLNNAEHESLDNAKNLIVEYWIENNRYRDALDILNQIPPLLRTDSDYRYFTHIYNLLNDPAKEKNALLFIQEKNIDELQRLAVLHSLTNDKIMAEYTWNDILKKNPGRVQKLNALSGLAHIYYNDEKYADTINLYDQYFKDLAQNVDHNLLLIQPKQAAKELIIASYLSNNRPKAETLLRSLKDFIENDDAVMAEIKLSEGIYYVNMDPKRANRPLTQIIEDGKVPSEIAYKALFWRGINHIQDNKDEQAERDFTIAMNTTDEELKNQVRLKLGTLFFNKGEPDKALDYYYQVIVNDRKGELSKDAAHNFAVVARQMQDWDKVIAAYRLIMERWGQSHLGAETRLTIAFSFYQAKQYDQAINLLNQLLNELDSDELKAEAQYWIAECYVGKLAYSEAVTAFLKVRYSYGNIAKWAGLSDLRLAETYLKQGQNERAIQLFNDIIRVHGARSDLGREASKYLAR